MTPDQFLTYAAEIPYNPRNDNAQGLLAPLIRSMGHILFLLGIMAAQTPEGQVLMTPEEKQNELTHAKDHIPPLADISDSPVLSTLAKTNILNYAALVAALEADWTSWNHNEQLSTLRATANAAAALGAFLDRELAGFRTDQSDPGRSL